MEKSQSEQKNIFDVTFDGEDMTAKQHEVVNMIYATPSHMSGGGGGGGGGGGSR